MVQKTGPLRHSDRFRSLIEGSCKRGGYWFDRLDEFSNSLFKISNPKNGLSFFTGMDQVCSYPTNSATAFSIVRDKAFTEQVLSFHGVPTPWTQHFFCNEQRSEIRPAGREKEDAERFARKIDYPVIVKPNKGSHARQVSLVFNPEELSGQLAEISKADYIAIIQEYCHGDTFRFFVANGVVRYRYCKDRLFLVGDGTTSISGLLSDLNRRLLEDGSSSINVKYRDFGDRLRDLSMSLESIPGVGEKIVVSAISSIAMGSGVSQYSEVVSADVARFFQGLSEAVKLDIIGVDVVCEDPEDPEGFRVIDVNGNPEIITPFLVDRRETAEAIWDDVMVRYFES